MHPTELKKEETTFYKSPLIDFNPNLHLACLPETSLSSPVKTPNNLWMGGFLDPAFSFFFENLTAGRYNDASTRSCDLLTGESSSEDTVLDLSCKREQKDFPNDILSPFESHTKTECGYCPSASSGELLPVENEIQQQSASSVSSVSLSTQEFSRYPQGTLFLPTDAASIQSWSGSSVTASSDDIFPLSACKSLSSLPSPLEVHSMLSYFPFGLEQNMVCPLCKKAFRFEKNLLRHLQKAHATGNGESILKCKLCTYTTRHYSNMYVHIRTHTGDKPYSCSGCGAAFTQGSSLKLHIKSRHNDNLSFFSLCRKPGKNNLTKLWTRVLKKDLPRYQSRVNSLVANYQRLTLQYLSNSRRTSSMTNRFSSIRLPPNPARLQGSVGLSPSHQHFKLLPKPAPKFPDLSSNCESEYKPKLLQPSHAGGNCGKKESNVSFMVESLTGTGNVTKAEPAEVLNLLPHISPFALYDAIMTNPTAFQSNTSTIKIEDTGIPSSKGLLAS